MTRVESKQPVTRQAAGLILLGAISGLGYALLLWLSWRFAADVPVADRPTLWMLALFGGQFVCYWSALRLAIRLPPTRGLLAGLFAGACLFRGLLLPSIPMHEIDIYRYIWDGAVFADGASPYRFSPQQVVAAVAAPGGTNDPALQRLVELQASSESLADTLREIHYGGYPSPYPLVSQTVFALSALITPDAASQHARVVIMKSLLVIFDLATFCVVMRLLGDIGLHPGLSLAYGWCPLLMKEIANGGHLDSIAIFLTTVAVWMLVRTWQVSAGPTRLPRSVGVVLTGAALALAIGAKLYPIVLLPLFAAVWLRRHSWATSLVGVVATALVAALPLYPMFGPAASPGAPPAAAPQVNSTPSPTVGQLNAPLATVPPTTFDPAAGVQAFLKHWEMNDLLFMVVLENLRQQNDILPQQAPWFVFTSDAWSRATVTRWAGLKQRLSGTRLAAATPAEPLAPAQLKAGSFLLARVITGGVFVLIAGVLAWRAAGNSDPQAWCRAGMLTLAWFWLTSPTQNPWYWCWVLPLLPFARYRSWHAIAAMTMLYYLRFWLSAHYANPPVLGTPYNGAYFFYFVVAWIEFFPCLLALAVEWFCWRRYPDRRY